MKTTSPASGLTRPTHVRCELCTDRIEVKARGRIPQFHARCKEIEAALIRIERLLDDHSAPDTIRGQQSLTWVRSRLWATANTLNRLGPPVRVRPKIVRAEPTRPIRFRNAEAAEEAA